MALPAATAAPPPVVNCNDAGPGSLRASVKGAASGDTIDLSGLPAGAGCSVITLTTGAIAISQSDLTITGPAARVTITGKNADSTEHDRIFDHTGTGTLALNHLEIEYGNLTAAIAGGCVYSASNVSLLASRISNCKVANFSLPDAFGGGLEVHGDLTLDSSAVTDNAAFCEVPNCSSAGGARVGGRVSIKYSTISGNRADFAAGLEVYAGGTIDHSTISGNTAGIFGTGGIVIGHGMPPDSITITNSTISGNVSGGFLGGIKSQMSITLANSTIAFNSAHRGKKGASYYGAGLDVNRTIAQYPVTVTLQSSLISNNVTDDAGEIDFSAENLSAAPTGADNLIRIAASEVPNGTISGCPLLGPLRDNGGATLTHALLSDSPAIGQGNNVTAQPFDQRGVVRVLPAGGSADIGAYEVDQADIVFNAGFDGCL